MPLIACPERLSRDLVFVVSVRGEPCRRCGGVADEALTRREIKACLKARRTGP